jgi:hypothetical protein
MGISSISVPSNLVAALLKQAPRRFECVFANCELHSTPGGMTASTDLFSLTRKIFGGHLRQRFSPNFESAKAMMELGEKLMIENSTEYVAVDLLLEKNGLVHAFLDLEQFPRLKGGDDFFNRKHEQYASAFPVLANVPKKAVDRDA